MMKVLSGSNNKPQPHHYSISYHQRCFAILWETARGNDTWNPLVVTRQSLCAVIVVLSLVVTPQSLCAVIVEQVLSSGSTLAWRPWCETASCCYNAPRVAWRCSKEIVLTYKSIPYLRPYRLHELANGMDKTLGLRFFLFLCLWSYISLLSACSPCVCARRKWQRGEILI